MCVCICVNICMYVFLYVYMYVYVCGPVLSHIIGGKRGVKVL